MNFVVIGTDHRLQNSECGLEGLLRALMGQQFLEPLDAVAEEYGEKIGESVGQRLALEKGVRWYNVDMTTEEKCKTGILLEEQRSRPTQGTIAFRIASDDVRENVWVEKLTQPGSGTKLVICGYLHLESLVGKLREKGHRVDKRVYLETVPEIKPWCAGEIPGSYEDPPD
jgi:hypothetical protein